jgi:hypothetical protein
VLLVRSEASGRRMGTCTHIPKQVTYASQVLGIASGRSCIGPAGREPEAPVSPMGRCADLIGSVMCGLVSSPGRTGTLRTVAHGMQLMIPVDTGRAHVLCCSLFQTARRREAAWMRTAVVTRYW